jgi:hypothetical protein
MLSNGETGGEGDGGDGQSSGGIDQSGTFQSFSRHRVEGVAVEPYGAAPSQIPGDWSMRKEGNGSGFLRGAVPRRGEGRLCGPAFVSITTHYTQNYSQKLLSDASC